MYISGVQWGVLIYALYRIRVSQANQPSCLPSYCFLVVKTFLVYLFQNFETCIPSLSPMVTVLGTRPAKCIPSCPESVPLDKHLHAPYCPPRPVPGNHHPVLCFCEFDFIYSIRQARMPAWLCLVYFTNFNRVIHFVPSDRILSFNIALHLHRLHFIYSSVD